MCGTLTWTIILSVLSVQPHSQIQCVPLTLGAVHHPWTLLMLSVDTHRKWLFPAPVVLYSSPGKGHTSKWHQQQGHRRQRSCVYQSALLPRQPPCDYCIPEELHTATSSHQQPLSTSHEQQTEILCVLLSRLCLSYMDYSLGWKTFPWVLNKLLPCCIFAFKQVVLKWSVGIKTQSLPLPLVAVGHHE